MPLTREVGQIHLIDLSQAGADRHVVGIDLGGRSRKEEPVSWVFIRIFQRRPSITI
jgi:hypothetical protein